MIHSTLTQLNLVWLTQPKWIFLSFNISKSRLTSLLVCTSNDSPAKGYVHVNYYVSSQDKKKRCQCKQCIHSVIMWLKCSVVTPVWCGLSPLFKCSWMKLWCFPCCVSVMYYLWLTHTSPCLPWQLKRIKKFEI